jgi:hypothetical protein
MTGYHAKIVNSKLDVLEALVNARSNVTKRSACVRSA